ncbi:MAG: LPXTG cell wall anchor domain-containing protein [Ruminococcus sp.]|nr:LPXTG cell wall anchor domain-containing protein [Ruminococcus sp.]
MKKLKKLLSIVLAVAMVMSLAVSVTADDTTISIKSYTTGTESYSAYKIFDVTSNGSGGYAYTIDSDDIFYSVIVGLSTSADNYDASSTSTPSYFVLTEVADTGTVKTYSVTQNTDRYPTSTASNWADEEGTGVVITGLVAAIEAYLEANPSTAATISSFTKSASSETDANGTYYTYTATVTEPGYYYITTSTGSVVMVDTTETGATISLTDKNEVPSVEKEVFEESTMTATTDDTDSDAAIGDTVYFKTTIDNIYGVSSLVLHDLMEDGLSLATSSIVVILYEGGSGTNTLELIPKSDNKTTGYDYELNTNPTHTASSEGGTWSSCTFEITFDTTQIATRAAEATSSFTVTKDSYIVVTYEAKVLSTATIYDSTASDSSNDNTTYVSYGDSSYTTVDLTQTYVYSVNLYKYTGGNNASGTLSGETGLAGAQFYLYNSDYSKVAEFTYDSATNTYKLKGWVAVADIDSFSATATDVIIITSVADSEINIEGLDAETLYYLHEIVAPSGYNLAATDTPFYIAGSDTSAVQGSAYTDSGVTTLATVTANDLTDAPTVIAVENKTGSEMPETGGIGVTIFYVVGGILVLAAAGVIVINRKKIKK